MHDDLLTCFEKIMQPGSPLLLSLSLNNPAQLPHQIQGNPQIQVSKINHISELIN